MEVLVSFTDKAEDEMIGQGYAYEQSELGKIYYPEGTLRFEEDAEVNYVEYPWITKFGVKGIKIVKKG